MINSRSKILVISNVSTLETAESAKRTAALRLDVVLPKFRVELLAADAETACRFFGSLQLHQKPGLRLNERGPSVFRKVVGGGRMARVADGT